MRFRQSEQTCRRGLSTGREQISQRRGHMRSRILSSKQICRVFAGGDQLGDFTDLFNAGQSVPARRAATQGPAIAKLWGAGWFVLPNPVYGSGLKGGFDDVFPADKRWAPPAQGEK